ncbi:glycerate kinase [Francisella adeliensis]|uniref:Glycerate kinase n=1 Tax=Francisella adeliensis TaxID=2007306 RepID=A0A2Z4XZ08_9GAMM|nr:glycerate kinase [Francisella adeliensis]AXA33655.1 glycerate kinase [Francisella adeliensis]MBK2085546.1 glycerate kinase [Francisella adeliensis]MBK2097424.1 glycerate kinase [Francisella adeliensis]QIW11889.1 glycerate kinase [Francisella adeliensis]QIW13765.1 glycerate kinase [Francisella adeliensis]
MKFVIAPDTFKNSLDASQVCLAIEKGFKKVFKFAEYTKIPVADGGEGSIDAIANNLSNAKYIKTKVLSASGKTIDAEYLTVNNTAIIELAKCCGLNLTDTKQMKPLEASTFGFGQLIKHALDNGFNKIILTLGGSCTNDVGIGLLQALGIKFLDVNKNTIQNCKLKDIDNIASIDISNIDSRISTTDFKVASDVDNVLYGQNGATFVYGQQKGLKSYQLSTIDENIKSFSKVCSHITNKNHHSTKGTGAAGGVGYALATFLNAEIVSGAELILDIIGFENSLKAADIVITGEGKMDQQSFNGKVPTIIAQKAKKHNSTVIAIVGSYDFSDNDLDNSNIDAVFSCINHYSDLDTILSSAAHNIEQTATNIAKFLAATKHITKI